MRRLPPLGSLEAFLRVARLGSAKAAAGELSLSPSALSRRIATLEDFVGKKLFIRQNQQLKLNEHGQAFFETVAPAMDSLANAIQVHIDEGRIVRLRLGVLPLFATQRLLPRLADLRRLYPMLHIDLDTSGHGENKLGDTLDAAIILSEAPDPSLHAVRLDQNYVHAIASKKLVEEIGREPSARILKEQTFLIYHDMPASYERWKQVLGLDDFTPASIDTYDSGPLLLESAAQGLGIAILHDDHISRSHDERLAPLFDVQIESPYSYWFVCKAKALESRPVRQFHDWMIEAGL